MRMIVSVALGRRRRARRAGGDHRVRRSPHRARASSTGTLCRGRRRPAASAGAWPRRRAAGRAAARRQRQSPGHAAGARRPSGRALSRHPGRSAGARLERPPGRQCRRLAGTSGGADPSGAGADRRHARDRGRAFMVRRAGDGVCTGLSSRRRRAGAARAGHASLARWRRLVQSNPGNALRRPAVRAHHCAAAGRTAGRSGRYGPSSRRRRRRPIIASKRRSIWCCGRRS